MQELPKGVLLVRLGRIVPPLGARLASGFSQPFFISGGVMPVTALKRPRSIQDQKMKLAAHGIEFEGYSDRDVEQILLRTNYYRLTGYALQFRVDPSHGTCAEKTQFRDIVTIYHFDSELRNFILRYTEPVEIKLRTVISYEYSMAHCTKYPHDQHLLETNYYRQRDARGIIDAFFEEEGYPDKPLLSVITLRNTEVMLQFG